MMGAESVGQILLAIVICAMWLCLLIHVKPYKLEWDNVVAITLAANLLLTIVSGMAFNCTVRYLIKTSTSEMVLERY